MFTYRYNVMEQTKDACINFSQDLNASCFHLEADKIKKCTQCLPNLYDYQTSSPLASTDLCLLYTYVKWVLLY